MCESALLSLERVIIIKLRIGISYVQKTRILGADNLKMIILIRVRPLYEKLSFVLK